MSSFLDLIFVGFSQLVLFKASFLLKHTVVSVKSWIFILYRAENKSKFLFRLIINKQHVITRTQLGLHWSLLRSMLCVTISKCSDSHVHSTGASTGRNLQRRRTWGRPKSKGHSAKRWGCGGGFRVKNHTQSPAVNVERCICGKRLRETSRDIKKVRGQRERRVTQM